MRRQEIPDLLSLMRLLLSIPLFFTLLFSDGRDFLAASSVALIVTMVITDYLDGSLARKWDCQRTNGAALDVAADIAMTLSASSALAANGTVSPFVFLAMAVFAVQFPLTSRIIDKAGIPSYDPLGKLAGMCCMVFPLAVIVSENIVPDVLVFMCQGAMIVICIAATANRLCLCRGRKN